MPSKGIGREFMEKTQYRYLGASPQQRGISPPPLEVGCDPGAVLLDLPAPSGIEVGTVAVRTAIENRQSVRRYAERALPLAELSYLLWCTQGVKGVERGYVTWRTVPSAGARHALETYLLVNRVEGLEPGLCRFLAIEHKLEQVNPDPGIGDAIAEACWGQRFVKTCAVTFIWVAVAYRMTWRYGERGYRYMHLDAGHVCQNLYLAAEAIECGVCAIAAFQDEELNRVLGIDGEKQFAIYVATVGKKP